MVLLRVSETAQPKFLVKVARKKGSFANHPYHKWKLMYVFLFYQIFSEFKGKLLDHLSKFSQFFLAEYEKHRRSAYWIKLSQLDFH